LRAACRDPGELGRRSVEDVLDGGDDLCERMVERTRDLRRVDRDPAQESGRKVATGDLRVTGDGLNIFSAGSREFV
jgi:hypothetical protein